MHTHAYVALPTGTTVTALTTVTTITAVVTRLSGPSRDHEAEP